MKILICGIGSIGRRHLKNLLSLGYRNIILYRTGKHTIENDEPTSKLKTFNNLDEALCTNPDVAFITNPTSLHIQVALKAAKKGCHLFLEKPISHNMVGVYELKKITDEKNLVTFVGCHLRFHPLLTQIKEIVDSGKIGKIFYARAEWSEYLPDWHTWEDYSKGYSARKDLGGGAIMTLIHSIDLLYWMIGKASEVKSENGKLSNLNLDVEDIAEIIIKFKSGAIGNVHVDFIQKPYVNTLTLNGLNGKIFWDYHAKFMEITDREGKKEIIKDPDGFEKNQMYIDELKHFLGCVKNKKKTINSLDQGIDTLNIALKAKNSTRL